MKKSSHTNAVLGIFFVVFLVLVGVSAADAAVPVPSEPMWQQNLGKVLIQEYGFCNIHKLNIDGTDYIINTCGGIVAAPK